MYAQDACQPKLLFIIFIDILLIVYTSMFNKIVSSIKLFMAKNEQVETDISQWSPPIRHETLKYFKYEACQLEASGRVPLALLCPDWSG